jgi:hypothetical protein
MAGFHRGMNGTFAVLCYYAALNVSWFATVCKKLSVPSSLVKLSCLTNGVGTDSPSQNVGNYHSALLNIPEQRRSLNMPVYVWIKISTNVL